jgi:hypothetical protein
MASLHHIPNQVMVSENHQLSQYEERRIEVYDK